MAITKLVKALEKAPVQVEEVVDTQLLGEDFDLEALVDRAIQLDTEVAAILADPRIKELADLKAKIKAYVDSNTEIGAIKKGQEKVLFGEGGHIEFSPCSMKRDVTNKGALLLAVGEKQFMDMAKFALGDIDKYTSEEVRQQVLTVDPHGGARSMKIVHTA